MRALQTSGRAGLCSMALFFSLTVISRAGMPLPDWRIGDWWELDQTVTIDVTQIFPGSTIVTHDVSRYTLESIENKTQTRTGQTYNVFVMSINGPLTIDGTIILLGIPTHVRVLNGTFTAEHWNRTSDLAWAMAYRQLAGQAEAESASSPGQWEPLGPLEINLYEEYDPPIPYGYPFDVGDDFQYTLVNHMFGDFSLQTSFGNFGDDFHGDSNWFLDCDVRSMQTDDCQYNEPSYYIYANHIQDGVNAVQEGWVEPCVKWYNKVELTRFAHPLGVVRHASLCLTDCQVTYTPPADPSLQLSLNRNLFAAGDRFNLTANLQSPSQENSVELYVVLDVSALGLENPYYFYPSWRNSSQGDDSEQLDLAVGATQQTILDFFWPEGAGEASGLVFWGAIMQPGTTDIIGDVQQATFGFH